MTTVAPRHRSLSGHSHRHRQRQTRLVLSRKGSFYQKKYNGGIRGGGDDCCVRKDGHGLWSCGVVVEGHGDFWSPLEMVVHGGIVGGILYSLVSSTSTHRGHPRRGTGDMMEDGFETAVRWSVMSILSCAPYVNYMAWVFAALDSSSSASFRSTQDTWATKERDQSRTYWSLAALYALPYIVDGCRLDLFTLLSLSLGVVHVQVERGMYYGDLESWLDSTRTLLTETLQRLGRQSMRSGPSYDIDLKHNDLEELEEEYDVIRRDLQEFDRRLDDVRSND